MSARRRILLFGLHAILEHDETRLLRGLGHAVLPMGDLFPGAPPNPFRPPLPPDAEEQALADLFAAEGGVRDHLLLWGNIRLPARFVEAFDAVVVPHSAPMVRAFLGVLGRRPVLLRTIGQEIAAQEPMLAELRGCGVRVVRYSPAEARVPGYAGADALIRFAQEPDDFAPWTGEDPRVLSFVNDFAARFPADLARWRAATEGLPATLGGRHNEGVPGWCGLVPPEAQRGLLRRSRAYLHAAGVGIPYTLNAIEAWTAGIPLVVLAEEAPGGLGEMPRLVAHGRTGFVARSPAEARDILATLLADHALAARVGAAGRTAATALFGRAVVAPQWQALLDDLPAR